MQRVHGSAHCGLRDLDERGSTLAEVGYSVRAPLGRIALRAQLLQRRLAARGTDPDVLEDLAFIDAASQAIAQQVDQLLHLTRASLGITTLPQRQAVDLVSSLRQLVAETRAATSGHSVVLDMPQGSVIGCWDPLQLHRAFANLLDNAIKFSSCGSEVRVHLARASGAAQVRITDRGVGIDADELPHVFEWFRHGGAGVEGLGIGLAISRLIVLQHGGSIKLTSQPGEGTTVTVVLPLSRVSVPVDVAA
jgi:signal transduction histidine kinase